MDDMEATQWIRHRVRLNEFERVVLLELVIHADDLVKASAAVAQSRTAGSAEQVEKPHGTYSKSAQTAAPVSAR